MLKPHRLTVALALCAASFYSNNTFAGNAPTFASPQFVETFIPAGNGDAMVMGDFNGDGVPDVAILGSVYNTNDQVSTGVVEVHFGNGANGFQSAVSTFTNTTSQGEFSGNLAQNFAAADLDGGTNSELIIPAGNAVLIYEWIGTRFVETQSIDLSGTGMTSAYWVAVGNLTTTNSRDIVVADEFGDVGVVWIPNDGHGNFGTPVAYPIGGGIGGEYAAPNTGAFHPLVLANVNGKNKLDDVILSWYDTATNTAGSEVGSTVGVLLNSGNNTLSSEVSYGNPTLVAVANSVVEPQGLTVADVDGDGKLDLVSLCATFNTKTGAETDYFSVNLGNGDGTFQAGRAFPIGSQGASALAAADFNGDGRVDIVTTAGPNDPGIFNITEWTGTGASLAIARQDNFHADSHYYNSLLLGYKNTNDVFVTFNNDTKVDVLIGTSDVFNDANNNPASQFVVFQNDSVITPPTLLPTTLNILGSKKIAPGAAIVFYATNLSTAPGLNVRVQSSSTPTIEGSWTDLPDGNGGQMSFTPLPKIPGIYSFGLAGTVYYPAGPAVYFRAITAAPGYVDSISPPIGPFALEQAQLTINAKLTSTTDPTGTLQTTHIGDILTCTLIWTNIGNAPATGLEVTMPVPTYQDATTTAIVQFPSSSLSFNSYGQYFPETSVGANDAKVVWKVSPLPPGSRQAETITIQVGPSVLTGQFIDIPNNYSVASTNGSPAVGATGFSSESPNRGVEVLAPISFTIASTSPTVAPGGLLTYTFALTNFSASIVTNPVVVVEVPQNTRFATSYTVGKKSVAGVAFVSPAIKGTLYKDVFYAAGAQSEVQSQVVISFGPLAAAPSAKGLNGVTFTVTFQAEWVDPAYVHAISTVNYLAAFMNPASYANFKTAFSEAGITTATAGPNDFYALISASSGNIALSQNGSGEVSVPFAGSLVGMPLLHLQKMLSASVNNLQDNGNGTTLDLVQPGQSITYMLTAYNDGANEADDVFIEDTMPQSSAFVSGSLLYNSTKSKSSPSTLASAATFTVVQDPDGQHLRFEGLHLAAGDYLSLQYTVTVFDGAPNSSQPAPAPDTFIDPIVHVDPTTGLPAPASIGSSSTPETWFGLYFDEPIEVIGTAQFAAPGIRTLFPHPAVSPDVNATSNVLTAFYQKYPNSVPLTAANNPLSFYPGIEQYYIHYQNSGAAVTGASMDVPIPVGAVFLRAAFVNLPANTTPGMPGSLPGTIIPNPKGAGIVLPSTPNGTVTFNLPSLAVGAGGDVMVEVIIAPDAVQENGSLLGDPNGSLVVIYDSTVTPAVRALARRQDDGSPPVVLVAPHSSMAPINALELSADFLAAPLSKIGLMKTVPQQVHPGDKFQISLVVFNYGDTDADPTTLLIIPDNAQYVSVDDGQGNAGWTVNPLFPNSAGAVEGTLASGNGPVVDATPLKAHTAAAMTVTLLATGPVGSTINGAANWDADPSNARVDMSYLGEAETPPTVTSIIDPGTPLSLLTTTVHTCLPLFQPTVSFSDVAIIDLGTDVTGNDILLVQGPADIVSSGAGNIVSSGAGNIVSAGAGNIVSAGAGNLISIGAGSVTAASLLADKASIVSAGAGNLLGGELAAMNAIAGANLLIAGSANIVGENSSGIVSQGAGNIVSAGAGNIVSAGAGNIVSAGAGNIVAQGAGNVVAAGGASVVSNDGGSLIANDGSSIAYNTRSNEEESASETSASTTGGVLVSTPASTAMIRTTAGNIFGVGGGGFRPYNSADLQNARISPR